jgi:hypothetical protein
MANYIEVDVPVLGKMVVPADTNPDDLMKAVGQYFGVDTTKQITTGQAVTRGLERAVTGTTRGVGQVMTATSGLERTAPGEDAIYDEFGNVISGGTAPSVQEQATGETVKQADLRKEFEYELAKLQGNKAAAYTGYVLGTIADPANLIGGIGSATVRSIVAEGIIAGGVQGFFDPLYGQEDTFKNRAVGAAAGATGGAVLGLGLGKALKKLGWLEKETPTVKGKDGADLPDVTDNVAKEMDSKIAEAAPTPKVEAPTEQVDEVVPTPSVTQDVTPTVPTFLDGYDATLPQGLNKAAPRYGRNVVGFESDLDRALYIIADGAKRSAADQKYLDWAKTTTGIDDEATLRALGAQVRTVVKNTPDVGNIPRTNLTLPNAPVARAEIAMPTAPFAGTVDKIGNSLNPESNAWVGLDNVSKNLYNIGRRFLDFDATGVKPRLLPLEQKQAYEVMKSIMPEMKANEMPDVFRSYAKVLDNLAEVRGNDFKAPSMEELMKNKISHEDFTELFNRGVFDGCAL